MQQSTRLQELVQERLDEVLAAHREELSQLGPDSAPVLDEAERFLAGGKRYRAQFAYLGYRAAAPLELRGEVSPELGSLIAAASALELFHAAALIHDDVIDKSDTRRGRPATHIVFETLHEKHGWRGSSKHFGITSAILLGDLLQSWADELFTEACAGASQPEYAAAARKLFNTMRSEVALGQYLDVVEENRPHFAEHEEQLERSTRVLIYKSAKYSVEAPLLIGAALAGATPEAMRALQEFGLPVGVAFQLRDDLLGAFGNEQLTGKPSGADLREGKRTVLATLARNTLPHTQRNVFDEMLGSALTDDEVGMLQQTIHASGAVDELESIISRNVAKAEQALDFAPIREDAQELLLQLAYRAARRDF